jgi:7-cyano-7-deazaguanine synthase
VVRSEGGQGAAVLCSGGLDSAVLLAEVARREGGLASAERLRPERGAKSPSESERGWGPASAEKVIPLYVSVGLAWEAEERAMLERLLSTETFRGVQPIEALRFDMRDVYPPTHWAIRGEPPGFDTPDEDVYLEGRNVVLLTKAAVFMARAGLARVYIGPLAGNPFPDATPEFFDAMARALSLGLDTSIEIAAPFAELHKADVIALGQSLGVPLELTLSCMQPAGGLHCGRCSKCRERRDAFLEAGVEDPTRYSVMPIR